MFRKQPRVKSHDACKTALAAVLLPIYTAPATIDATPRSVPPKPHPGPRPETQGWVLRALCRHNVVGNGSSSMIRRAAFEHCGGYEPSLRAAHAQGCEDMLIAMRIAEQYQFRVVRRHVTGYRYTPTSMSGDVLHMVRSFAQIRARYVTSHPESAAELDPHRSAICHWPCHH